MIPVVFSVAYFLMDSWFVVVLFNILLRGSMLLKNGHSGSPKREQHEGIKNLGGDDCFLSKESETPLTGSRDDEEYLTLVGYVY